MNDKSTVTVSRNSCDYEKLFETEIGCDVIIHAGEGQNSKEIHAHSNILCIRSQYFRLAFSNEWAKKRDGKFIFKKPNISPQLFNIILRFIYCGNIVLKNLQGPDVLELLIAVDELNINSLHETFTDLWNFCLEKICEEPKILFSSDKFINLKAPLLELLLKRDDLNIDEIEIWENLLKWCFAQQNIRDDSTKWSKEDIIRVERELYKFIPLIRFYDIEPTDFFYKVYCYKDVLPQDLIHGLLEYHIVPDIKSKVNLSPSRKPNLKYPLDSTLIKSNHLPLFVSWIDKKYSSHYRKNVPYDFKLLYRSSQDGVDTLSFHKNCDNKGATIWVAKIKNSTQIIGGYNPLDWNGKAVWKTTTNNFIFNFINGKNISTAKEFQKIISK
ncbi:BTB/POZ protein [Rhizophagus irregularis DAOM 181602=DAOM 197198]|nr:BTB/POZ protein [Rhizophagus irregularis DAOM 181602=DAOM 197198]